MGKQQTNPESDFHRRFLEKDRAASLRAGRIGIWVTGGLLVAFTLLNTVLALETHLPFWSVLQIEAVIVGGCGLMFYLMGWTPYQEGKRPVTDQEVEARRQQERRQLLREAQGILPLAFRPWRLILESGVSVLLFVVGVALLVAPGSSPRDRLWGLVYGICCIASGILLLWFALFIKRRRARQIPGESARELEYRLTIGEITEGNDRAGDER